MYVRTGSAWSVELGMALRPSPAFGYKCDIVRMHRVSCMLSCVRLRGENMPIMRGERLRKSHRKSMQPNCWYTLEPGSTFNVRELKYYGTQANEWRSEQSRARYVPGRSLYCLYVVLVIVDFIRLSRTSTYRTRTGYEYTLYGDGDTCCCDIPSLQQDAYWHILPEVGML